jgi:hypothetical protein
MSELIIFPRSSIRLKLPLLQGEGRGEDGFTASFTRPIPTLILPLKGRKLAGDIEHV